MCVDCATGGSVIGEGLSAGGERPWRKKTLICVCLHSAFVSVVYLPLVFVSHSPSVSLEPLIVLSCCPCCLFSCVIIKGP